MRTWLRLLREAIRLIRMILSLGLVWFCARVWCALVQPSEQRRLHGVAACGAVPGLGKRGEREGRGKTKKASIATGWALLGRGTIAGFLNGLHAEIHPGDAMHSIIPKVLQENHRWLWRKPRTDGRRHAMQCGRWGKGNKMAVASSQTTRRRRQKQTGPNRERRGGGKGGTEQREGVIGRD